MFCDMYMVIYNIPNYLWQPTYDNEVAGNGHEDVAVNGRHVVLLDQDPRGHANHRATAHLSIN